ncbi:FG-GAP-like repeat-containing protein [Nannocystis pusilla]|uniref:FG-GAP-like repeat-containing protein n=1 Tax=Nannocystis pusilla TaxID=889268 RepID=A0ABS7TTA5_9BACT|nr:FG-GAP-like repeat-containing protein [Nannocystis pusilla]MBZ5711448.1 FG-GAP-like repeat-containing protein [Nannocystis pusilla]
MRGRCALVHLLALVCGCNGRTVPEQTDGGGTTTTTNTGADEPPATTTTDAPTTSSGEAPTTGAPPVPGTCGNGIVEPGEVCLGTPVQIDATPVERVSTADLDGDGRSDVLTGAGVWLQREGGLEAGTVPAIGPAFKVGDFDGDGHGDLVAHDGEARTLALSRGDGMGGFAAPIVTVVSKLNGIFVVDVDADGRDEIVGQAPELDALRTYAAGDDGLFVPLAIQPMSAWNGVRGDGDADGDGFADLLVGESQETRIWWGQGDGSFVAAEEPLPSQMYFKLADLEGDGTDELLFAFADVWWDFATYSAGALWLAGAQAEWPRAEVALEDFAVEFLAGDMSNDGLGDVIVAHLGGPEEPVLEVLCSAPGRVLSRCATLALDVTPAALAALDVNADGALDVVLAAGEAGLWVVPAEP